MADQDNGAAAGTQQGNVTDIEQIKAALAAAQAESAQAKADAAAVTTRLTAMEAEARTGRLKALAAGFSGGEVTHFSVLEHLATSAGEESEVFKAYVTAQTAQSEQIKASNLFKEVGLGGQGGGDSAFGKLSAIATEIASKENLTQAQSFAAACERNKSLYDQYVNERR